MEIVNDISNERLMDHRDKLNKFTKDRLPKTFNKKQQELIKESIEVTISSYHSIVINKDRTGLDLDEIELMESRIKELKVLLAEL